MQAEPVSAAARFWGGCSATLAPSGAGVNMRRPALTDPETA
jgi:hypothetical protein